MPLVTLMNRSGYSSANPENLLAHEVRVQLSDSVDFVAADDRDMRHAHAAIALVVDDGQGSAAAVVAGVSRFDR
jgi:hypothetical protein